MILCLFMVPRITNFIEPSGSDSTSGRIDPKLSAPAYFEPNLMII